MSQRLNKKEFIGGIIAALILSSILFIGGREELVMRIGSTDYVVQKLESQAERIKGLSGKKELPENAIMLFVFNTPNTYGIWMKDMYFPIDILWLNGEGEVVHIAEAISPDTYPNIFYPEVPALYVIEANAGFVQKEGIKIGNKLLLP